MSKRQHKRYIKRCETEFISNNITYRGISSNFSLKGLFIRTKYPLPPGSVVDITIIIQENLVSRIKGRVIRAEKDLTGKIVGVPGFTGKNGMGIEVIERDVNYLHLIRTLVP